MSREAAEERSVSGVHAGETVCPGVRRLVAEGVVPLACGEVRGDRDPVRAAVADLAAGQLAMREADDGLAESEAHREAIVEVLETGTLVRRIVGEEGEHRIRVTGAFGTRSRETGNVKRETRKAAPTVSRFTFYACRFLYQSALICW